jgi:hypothetical protein
LQNCIGCGLSSNLIRFGEDLGFKECSSHSGSRKKTISGRFPTVTARRLRNIVVECFAPRYLVAGGAPAAHLKRLSATISTADLTQLMLVFTSRANPILGDFVRHVYWARYAGGYTQITNDDARAFVERGIDDGKTIIRWSETTVRRVASAPSDATLLYFRALSI